MSATRGGVGSRLSLKIFMTPYSARRDGDSMFQNTLARYPTDMYNVHVHMQHSLSNAFRSEIRSRHDAAHLQAYCLHCGVSASSSTCSWTSASPTCRAKLSSRHRYRRRLTVFPAIALCVEPHHLMRNVSGRHLLLSSKEILQVVNIGYVPSNGGARLFAQLTHDELTMVDSGHRNKRCTQLTVKGGLPAHATDEDCCIVRLAHVGMESSQFKVTTAQNWSSYRGSLDVFSFSGSMEAGRCN